MTSCPKCQRLMVALFQVPRCEHCELGGPEVGIVYAACKPLKSNGYDSCSFFPELRVAALWMKELKEKREIVGLAIHRVVPSKRMKQPVVWLRDLPKDHPLAGERYLDGYLCRDEAVVESFARGLDLNLFVPLKP